MPVDASAFACTASLAQLFCMARRRPASRQHQEEYQSTQYVFVQEHVLQPHSRRKLSLQVEARSTATAAPTREAAATASAPVTSSSAASSTPQLPNGQQDAANGHASDQSQHDHSRPASGKEDTSLPDTSENGHIKLDRHELKAVQQGTKAVQRVDDIWAWKRRQSVAASPR